MDEMPELTEPQRDDVAVRLVHQARTRRRLPSYRNLVRNLLLLLRQHGLGQTLAYLQSRIGDRTDTPYLTLYQELGSWLQSRLSLPPGDILVALTSADSRVYLAASEEASQFALALKRALIEEQAGDSAGNDPGTRKEAE